MTTDLLSAQRYSLAAVVRIVGAQDAEDVLQEAALLAWRKQDQFRNGARYETWFWKIAVNTALMHLRANWRKKNCVHLNEAMYVEGDGETPEQFAARSERAEKLYSALLKLRKGRKLAALRWLAGETARGAEKAARHKAKQQLREMLCAGAQP